ncbi:hypothetical protein [Myxococcus virescens]|uniref:DUF2116 family Zn-ribbon domain-containing protein n=1 Tax=Myxococcus virescens TaxID=83456 RepID=A0A511HP79_9BACT|nr:hypothetical protein [Myxococcus virescens]GEL75184.1 hypothetical protein MVI01_69680 [Myxococcus virescens]SDD64707.1 hypothetical protein SAMN04488504_102109 [Myxococcus virescens]
MTACPQRLCADERCGKPVPQGKDYCGRACRKRVTERARWRRRRGTGRTKGTPVFIRNLRALTPPGLCVYCDAPLPGIRRYVCGERDCLRAYESDFRREQRAIARGEVPELVQVPEDSVVSECAAELRAGTQRLALQLDALRAGVRELCEQLSCEVRH